MSFSEREINTIHASTSFVDGRKYFGEFDNLVTAKPTIERVIGNQDLKVNATILVPIMERLEKLAMFLSLLKESLDQSQQRVSLTFLDNSIERKLWQLIKDADFGSSVTEILYFHDPRMTQSGRRNTAVTYLPPECKVKGGIKIPRVRYIYNRSSIFMNLSSRIPMY